MDKGLLKELSSFKNRNIRSLENCEDSKNTNAKIKDRTRTKKSKKTTNYKESVTALDNGLDNMMSAKKKSESISTLFGNGKTRNKYGIVAMMVDELRKRYLDGNFEPITFEQLLDLTHSTDINEMDRLWIISEALPTNSRVSMVENNMVIYKSPLESLYLKLNDGSLVSQNKHNSTKKDDDGSNQYLPNKKTLYTVLSRLNVNGGQGLLKSQIIESVPKAEKAIKSLLNNRIIEISRTDDVQQKVYFINEHSKFSIPNMDVDLIKIWRSIPPPDDDSVNNSSKRNEDIKKNGSKILKRKKPRIQLQNSHLSQDILKDFSVGNN